jgi:hypothetical protein
MKYITPLGFFSDRLPFFYKYIIPLGFPFYNSVGVKNYPDNSDYCCKGFLNFQLVTTCLQGKFK